eukprot:5771929-Amphidinium_carterae.1
MAAPTGIKHHQGLVPSAIQGQGAMIKSTAKTEECQHTCEPLPAMSAAKECIFNREDRTFVEDRKMSASSRSFVSCPEIGSEPYHSFKNNYRINSENNFVV